MQQFNKDDGTATRALQHGSYQLDVFRSAIDLPEHCRAGIIDLLNEIISTNWRLDSPWWSASDTPFQDGYGIGLVRLAGQIVGFSIWRRLSIDGRPAICRSGIELRPEHQRKGLFGLLLKGILDAELAAVPAGAEIYYTWRTRNPVAWSAHARTCKRLLPSLSDGKGDDSLKDAAIQIARILYPDRELEFPNLIVRNSYPNITYYTQPTYESDSALTETFRRIVPDTRDAIFTVGIVARPST
jgi:GNAT superfamily N-acetyltransferase